MKWNELVVAGLLIGGPGCFEAQEIVIGGANFSSPPDAAWVISLEGGITPLTFASLNGEYAAIVSVSINRAKEAILGGYNANPEQQSAWLVSPSGKVTPLNFPNLEGEYSGVEGVAINDGGKCLVGGTNETNPSEAAWFVDPQGNIIDLNFSNLVGASQSGIYGVAINDAGQCVLGGANGGLGEGQNGWLIDSTGAITNLTFSNLSGFGDYIYDVGINGKGVSVLAGENGANNGESGWLVDPSGNITNLNFSNLTNVNSSLSACAINDAGISIFGGTNVDFPSEAAWLVDPYGNVTNLTLPNLTGFESTISSVGINQAGTVILGGYNGGDLNQAVWLISPEGTITPLNIPNFGDFPVGNPVAINDAGIAVAGGAGATPEVNLIAPNGTITTFTLPNFTNGFIYTVAISNAATPPSTGSYGASEQTALTASYALESHLKSNQIRKRNGLSQGRNSASGEIEEERLLADAKFPKQGNKPSNLSSPSYTLWVAPFGALIYQAKEEVIPSYSNQIVGGLLGFDCQREDNLVGAAVAYAFDHVRYAQKLGRANLNEELGVFYGATKWGRFGIDGAVWGGGYQVTNQRRTLPGVLINPIVSTGKTKGWILSPHLELNWNRYRPNPVASFQLFVMADWVNSWQRSYTEKGTSGFNLVIPSLYSSLLRSEGGVRLYHKRERRWGTLLAWAKASYINETPFDTQAATTLFIGAPAASSFSIVTTSSQMQNMGGVELHLALFPKRKWYPYGSIDFQGQFGSMQQTYFINLELGKTF
jgi:hypothetical protein